MLASADVVLHHDTRLGETGKGKSTERVSSATAVRPCQEDSLRGTFYR